MGKKKSMALMILLTIVIVVLCALTVFPAFSVPKTVVKWNPAVLQYDLGTDLGGSYYTYYYPQGVITETEYEALDEEKKESYSSHNGLYLSDEDKYNIFAGGEISEEFTAELQKAAKAIANRFAACGYSDYRVSIVDDFAIGVEIPSSDVNAATAMSRFALTGEMTLKKGGEVIEELKGEDAKVSDLIKGFSVKTQYDVAYVQVELTREGKEMIKDIKGSLSSSTDAQNATDSSSITSLDVVVGDTPMLQILSDYVGSNNVVKVPLAYDKDKDYVDMVAVLLETILEEGGDGFDIQFRTLLDGDIRSREVNENTLTAIYIALAVVIVALIAASIVKMGRFGVVNTYTTLSYLIVTGLCFAFISKGVFEITLGSILVFVMGLVLTTVLNVRVYDAIKKEFALGKTVESSVKGGYNKTLWSVVDIYAVLLLGALALLIGAAGLQTMALQAIICIVTGAFCNLLWGRAINFTFLSASKNKYQYFRFVREDDDDE